jgi:hypothetical protein
MEVADTFVEDSLKVRVTPVNDGAFVDMSHRNGQATVSWRSITEYHNYTLMASVPLQHRRIVFRSKGCPASLRSTFSALSGCKGQFGRVKAASASQYSAWLALLFDGVQGSTIMTAKCSGPGVAVLADNLFNINGVGESGKFSRIKKATQLGVKLTYDMEDPETLSSLGTGGLGPAYVVDIIRCGFPSDDSIGSFKIMPEKEPSKPPPVEMKMEGEEDELFDEVVPPRGKSKAVSRPVSRPVVAEVSSSLKAYYF